MKLRSYPPIAHHSARLDPGPHKQKLHRKTHRHFRDCAAIKLTRKRRRKHVPSDNIMDDITSLTTLQLAEYSRARALGRCLLAQFTDREVVVYQAYKPELGNFAAEHNYFGNGFSFDRTSWIKPNFTWMMHRCGWATKPNQEVCTAISGVLPLGRRVRRLAVPTFLQKLFIFADGFR